MLDNVKIIDTAEAYRIFEPLCSIDSMAIIRPKVPKFNKDRDGDSPTNNFPTCQLTNNQEIRFFFRGNNS
jgi:hypothetical protein